MPEIGEGDFSKDQARRHFIEVLYDIRPYGSDWGRDGVLSTIIEEPEKDDNVEGKIIKAGDNFNQVYRVTSAHKQMERFYTFKPDGSIVFTVNAFHLGDARIISGSMDPTKRQLTVDTVSTNDVPISHHTVKLP